MSVASAYEKAVSKGQYRVAFMVEASDAVIEASTLMIGVAADIASLTKTEEEIRSAISSITDNMFGRLAAAVVPVSAEVA